MKHESYGRYLVTTKDVCFLTDWGEPKCRKFIRLIKAGQGLTKPICLPLIKHKVESSE